jgi:Lrp/AsnC family transcriptional regulator for asnA, asnC and gidA
MESLGKPRLDKLDWRILYELDCDGFQSLAEIGKKLRVGRDVMHYRVKRLEELGVIRKYITLIDYGKLGYLMGELYVKLQHDEPAVRKEIIEYYRSKQYVWRLNEIRQHYDLAAGVLGRDLAEIREREKELLKPYKKYFHDVTFIIYNCFYQLVRTYFSSEQKREKGACVRVGAKAERMIDETDEKILRSIVENARKAYVEVANELGLSAAQVNYRINGMKEKKVILGARPLIDLSKIGYELFRLEIYLDDYNVYDKILEFLFSLPNVVYIYDGIGGADIAVDIEIKNYEEFVRLLEKIKERFAPAIAYTEYYQFTTEHKHVYFP